LVTIKLLWPVSVMILVFMPEIAVWHVYVNIKIYMCRTYILFAYTVVYCGPVVGTRAWYSRNTSREELHVKRRAYAVH
jgi:hypothetical protein